MGAKTCEGLQISDLVNGIDNCIRTLNKTQQCLYRSDYEGAIREGRYELLNVVRQIQEQNCRKPSLVPKEDLEREMFMLEMECKFEETKIRHVRREWTQQQDTLAKLQERLYRKCRLLSLHSNYSSTQGSALCAILAVLMEHPEVVESFLSEPNSYLKNLIKIADGCLFSFVKTYVQDNVLEDSNDYRYIIALYTCLVHISKVPKGREFLIQRKECQNMLTEIIDLVPYIKNSTAKALKIMLLEILFNLTNEPAGIKFLQESPGIFLTLNGCMNLEYHPEIHKFALELLECTTREIPTKEYVEKITNMINAQRLKELSGQTYREVHHIPRKIFQNIRIAADKIVAQEQQQAQGDVLRSKSAGSVCKCESSKSLELRGKRSAPSVKSKSKPQNKQNITPPTRDAPKTTSRNTASRRTPQEVPSAKPAPLCSSDCKYLFPDSPCTCRPHSSRENPSNIPVRKTCIPCCSGRYRKQELTPDSSRLPASRKTPSSRSKTSSKNSSCNKPYSETSTLFSSRPSSPDGPSFGSKKSLKSRSSSCNRPSSGGKQLKKSRSSSRDKPSTSGTSCTSKSMPTSCSRISCKSKSSSRALCHRARSLGRIGYIKDRIIDLVSTASRKLRGLYQTAPSISKPPCAIKTSFGAKVSSNMSKKSSKGWNKSSIPIFTGNRTASHPPCCNSKPSCSNSTKKISCPCTSTSKHKPKQKLPSHKTNRVCVPECTGTCKHRKQKEPPSQKSSKQTRNPCSCITSKDKSTSPEPISAERKFSASQSKQTPSNPESTKPVRIVCTDKLANLELQNVVLFPQSIENKTPAEESPTAKQDGEEIKSAGVPICVSSLGYTNATSPANSSPSIKAEYEEGICACGSMSERRLVPWTAENRMVARLGEMDRRVFHRVQNTVRIISRLDNNGVARTQRVVARIRIPGLRAQRVAVMDPQRKT